MSISKGFFKTKFIYLLIASGFMGFAMTLLVYVKCKPLLKDKDYTFHEPAVNKNDIIDSFNQTYLDSIEPVFKKYDSLRKRIEHLNSIKAQTTKK